MGQLFEDAVDRFPNRVAVAMRDKTLTYAEINARANQLAGFLRSKGVARETIVGLLSDRRPEMIVGILGIVKAGGCYLPINPDFPKDRIRFMLKDSGAPILLATHDLFDKAPDYTGETYDLLDMEIYEGDDSNPNHLNSPGDRLYIIYTSGSTGRPKGVVLQHYNIVRLLKNDRFGAPDYYDFNERDIWTMFHSYCFDFSVWEMYGALLYGGKLVIVPRETTVDPRAFLALLKRERVTVLNQTPGSFYNLIDEDLKSQGSDLCLRFIIFGGEELKPAMLKPWCLKHPKTRLVNMYGITETTVHVTYKEIGPDEIERGISNIGLPIPTLKLYVMDEELRLAPFGLPGEICGAGLGLAREYLGLPEKTAEVFVDNPILPGERIYRSGDLARRLPNGDLEYLGRKDFQIQVRGFRVEIGEVENRLLEHPDVSKAAVIARDDASGAKYMTAYLVASINLSVTELRVFLLLSLPEYMVPSYFIQLKSLPLTPNGKVDRRALPAPDRTRPELETEFIAPRNAVEKRLAEWWREILELDRVSVKDNFFELGGHSLQLTRLVSRINEAFKTDLPISRAFRMTSIDEIGRIINERLVARETSAEEHHEFSISVIHERENLPLSYCQTGLWFIMQLADPAYNIPFIIRFSGRLNITVLEISLNEIIRRHDALRTTFPISDGRPYQSIAPSLTVTLPIVDLSHLSVEERELEVKRLARDEALRPVDPTRGPLLRFLMLKLDHQEFILLFTVHHIVFDGWSYGVFNRELTVLYDAFSKGEASPLPELPFQFADYAFGQHQWLQGKVLETLLSYWKKRLAGLPPLLPLPSDRPRPALQTYQGSTAFFDIDPEMTRRLQDLGRPSNASLFMTLLTAITVLLYRYTDQEDIAVGSPIANRIPYETEELIGFFVNTLVLRTNLSGNPAFRQLLARVRETALDAYTHQGMPFERLIEELQPEFELQPAISGHVHSAERPNAGAGIREGASGRPGNGQSYSQVRFDHRADGAGWGVEG